MTLQNSMLQFLSQIRYKSYHLQGFWFFLATHCPSQFTTNTNHVPVTNEMCSFADDSWSWRLVLCLCSCSSSKPQMTQYLFCVRATKHLFSIFYLSWIICWSTWIDKQLQWGTFHQKTCYHSTKIFCFKHIKCCHCMLISTSELAKCFYLQFSSWS